MNDLNSFNSHDTLTKSNRTLKARAALDYLMLKSHDHKSVRKLSCVGLCSHVDG